MSEAIALPLSLAAYGTDAFAQTLAHELRDNIWKLPLEKLCKKGGWPYKDGLFSLYDIEVTDGDDCHSEPQAKNLFQDESTNQTRNSGTLHITCGVTFEEAIPSCCAGPGATDTRMGNLSLTIDKATAIAAASVNEI